MSTAALYDAVAAAVAGVFDVLEYPKTQPTPFAWVTYEGHAFEGSRKAQGRIAVIVVSSIHETPGADRLAIGHAEQLIPALQALPHCYLREVEAGDSETLANIRYNSIRFGLEERR